MLAVSLSNIISGIVFGCLSVLVPLPSAVAQDLAPTSVTNIVLVHGAWANGSSWGKVIPLLEAMGFHVTAVHIPLTSIADDVATTQRAIALQDGPTLLVARSYGGAVITEAGTDPKVVGLVYVDGFAPDQGQAVIDLGKGFPIPPRTKRANAPQIRFSQDHPKGNAARMHETAISIPSSHVVMLSHPF
jgi:pimeloyl-ACP methyl ester carboxylesterase